MNADENKKTSGARPHVPSGVKRQLRKEVGFGCPVPSCNRSPFLEFHHFDPPWAVREHMDANGMIALCKECHGEAGNWSVEEIRRLKTSAERLKPVKGVFRSWKKPAMLVRLGGNYAMGSEVIVSCGQEPVFKLEANGESGLLELSFVLADRRGEPIMVMENNGMELSPDRVDDLEANCSKTYMKVWSSRDNVGLEIRFTLISWERLVAMMNKDRNTARKQPRASRRSLKELIEAMPQDGDWCSRIAQMPRDGIDHAQSGHIEVGHLDGLKQSFKRSCNEKGKLALIDVEKMAFYHRGVRTDIRNGVRRNNMAIAGNIVVDNAGNAIDLPAYSVAFIGTRDMYRYAISNGVSWNDRSELTYEGHAFSREVLVIDGMSFRNCTFNDCHLIYKGGEVPHFSGCDCNVLWVFDEAAVRTLTWLQYLYRGFGEFTRETVDQIVEDIRTLPLASHEP